MPADTQTYGRHDLCHARECEPTMKTLHIKLKAIPEDEESLFAGPETVDSEEFRIRNSDIRNTIQSILNNYEDSRTLSYLVSLRIDSILFQKPRPEEDGTRWFVIKRHTPDVIWPSFTYFVPDSLNTIEWYVALESEYVKSLIERGELVIEFK